MVEAMQSWYGWSYIVIKLANYCTYICPMLSSIGPIPLINYVILTATEYNQIHSYCDKD